jgi:hypothetical protein
MKMRGRDKTWVAEGTNSLLNRTGNFVESAVNRRHVTSNRWLFSIGYESNSLTIGTGISAIKQGSKSAKQGICRRYQGSPIGLD